MKVAIVHDWLNGMRGGERCLQAFLSIYPDADVFALFHVPGSTSAEIDVHVKKVSFLNSLPFANRYYRALLPFFPAAARSFDLRGYDVIISLSHAAAKNVRVPKGALHICYCFTPMRYIWDQVSLYLGGKSVPLWPFVRRLRDWDVRGSQRVDHFVAISQFVAARIRCFYHRDADVIYPPVDTDWIQRQLSVTDMRRRGGAFLYAGALVPYKRPDLVIEAFNRLGAELWVVGTGPMEKALKKQAGSNILFFGHLADAELAECFRRCRALIFPGTEDFGMIPVECMAAGRPVIGIYRGGIKESVCGVKHWEKDALIELGKGAASGVFIKRSKEGLETELMRAVEFFIQHEQEFSEQACKKQASQFGVESFFAQWHRLALRFGIDSGRSGDLLVSAMHG